MHQLVEGSLFHSKSNCLARLSARERFFPNRSIKVKEDNELELEIAEGVKIRVVQNTIATVTSKTEPAK